MGKFRDYFRAGVEGIKEGANDTEREEWQFHLDNLYEDIDLDSVSDEEVVKKYFDFGANYPQQRMLDKFRNSLDYMMQKRPGTIKIIQEYTNKAKESKGE